MVLTPADTKRALPPTTSAATNGRCLRCSCRRSLSRGLPCRRPLSHRSGWQCRPLKDLGMPDLEAAKRPVAQLTLRDQMIPAVFKASSRLLLIDVIDSMAGRDASSGAKIARLGFPDAICDSTSSTTSTAEARCSSESGTL